MPFTFSHPAAILPFCKTNKIPVSVTGLVIGSMVPDFEFLFLLRESDYIGHQWPGIILFNIPAAVAAAFIFHCMVRNSLILHLPQFLQQRFSSFLSFNWKLYFREHYISFIVCAMAGAALHVFIDAFTHKDGFMASPAAFFQSDINLLIVSLPVYFFLQLLTSLAGALYLLWFVLRLPKEKSLQYNCRPVQYWLVYLISIPCILFVRFSVNKNYNTVDDIIIAVTGSLLYALVFISIVYYKQTQQQTKRLLT